MERRWLVLAAIAVAIVFLGVGVVATQNDRSSSRTQNVSAARSRNREAGDAPSSTSSSLDEHDEAATSSTSAVRSSSTTAPRGAIATTTPVSTSGTATTATSAPRQRGWVAVATVTHKPGDSASVDSSRFDIPQKTARFVIDNFEDANDLDTPYLSWEIIDSTDSTAVARGSCANDSSHAQCTNDYAYQFDVSPSGENRYFARVSSPTSSRWTVHIDAYLP